MNPESAMGSEMMMDDPAMGSAGPAVNSKPQNAMRQFVARPSDPSNWSTRDITAAIEERDVAVVDALVAYADQHQGLDNSAQEVVGWLQILNQPPVQVQKAQPANGGPMNPGYPSSGGGGYPSSGGGYQSSGGAGGSTNVPNSGGATFDPSAGPGAGYSEPDGEEMMEDPADYESMMNEGMMPGVPGGGRGKAGSAAADEQIASALIDTLVSIHSLTSFQAARDLLEGSLLLPFVPEKTAGWTMTSLIKHVEGAHDPGGKILTQSIQQPDQVRTGSGDFDASRLQAVALREHWTSALSVVDGLMGLKSSGLSQNKQRQNSNGYEGEMYMTPDGTSGGYSGGPGSISGSFPGAPNNQPQTGDTNDANPIPADLTLTDFTREEALSASQYLWSDQLVSSVAQRLNESETLMKDPSLLLLAGQLPNTSTRFAFQKFLEKNWLMDDDWTRNPSSFVKYNVFSKYLRDPGLVITLKQLPREQQTSPNAGGPDGSYEGGGPQVNPNNRQAQDPEKQREQRVKQLWFETSEKFTLGLMDRMLAAADQGQLPPSNEDELDIRLHRNASVTYDARLELALGEASADSEQDTRDKTVVNYIRIESNDLDQRAVTHYKSALKKETEFLILNNNGMWLSSPVEKDRKTGQLVSVDVLLSKSNARPPIRRQNQQQQPGFNDIAAAPPGNYGEGGGGNQTFVIEILVVRVPNPEVFLQQSGEAVSVK